MSPLTQSVHLDAGRQEAMCAQLLTLIGLGLFLSAAVLDPEGSRQFNFEAHDMWIKILGLVCAGVFIGATLIEVKQFRLRKRDQDSTTGDSAIDDPAEQEGDGAAAENS